MNHISRQKLLNELADLEKLKKLYRKHVDDKIAAIEKLNARTIKINWILANDPE